MTDDTAKLCMFGLVAEFEDADSLKAAAQSASDAGYTKMSAYAPFYVEGLDEIVRGKRNSTLPWLLLGGLILGAAFGFMLQFYASTVGYDINVGGRALGSWQAFIPITFETAILGAALALVTGYFLNIGLPLPYHPIFNAENIDLASRSRFFLCIETKDNRFHLVQTNEFLQSLEPVNVSEVTC